MIADVPLMETAGCLCWASRRVARAFTRAFDQALRGHGLRATQFSLLAILALKGAQAMTELAETLGADRTTLTRNLALVEGEGLVEIRPGEDARARIVAITPKGRARLNGAFATWRETQAGILAAIGQPMADNLRKLSRGAAAATL